MSSASILIKPASSACNIRCKYCFYRSLSGERSCPNAGMMTYDTLEVLVKNALCYADEFCSFAFQGGEPTLAGLDFYKKLIELQHKYNTNDTKIQNTIQTNGILIDDEWAEFLGENDFLVGLSLDGDRKLNQFREDNGGNNTFDRIMNTVRVFEKHGVQYNIVSVVTSLTAKNTAELYSFFKKHGFMYQQYIPCLDEKPDKKYGYSLSPRAYGKFLCELFDLWYKDFISGYNLDIRIFSNWVQMAAGYQPESCGMSGRCVCYFVVEGDGSVYPCDFYAADQWKLGTVQDDFDALIESKKAKDFVSCSLPIHEKCRKCRHLYLCRGGCRRWREPFVNGEPSLNCLCTAYEMFFEHCADRIYLLGKALRKQLEAK